MLRDDLFLDSRGAAPAVVRSYEACEPEAQLRFRLRDTLNATLAARRSAVAAPLPILAVIYFGTHHERLHAVRAYERYFRRLVYMSPNREIVRAVGELRSRGGSSGAEVHAHHCTRWIKATYMCLASVAPALMDGLRGVLYMHFDLWLQPWSLRALPLDAVWSLPRHRIMQKGGGPSHLLPLHCFDASEPVAYTLNGSAPNAWTWARDLPAAREATRATCGRRHGGGGGGGGCRAERVCIGWVDMYYLPARVLPAFGSLAAVYASHGRQGVNHELAVPTMLEQLAPTGGGARRMLDCWGYCCSVTLCPELLLRHACGHRMQLALAHVRGTFDSLWGGHDLGGE